MVFWKPKALGYAEQGLLVAFHPGGIGFLGGVEGQGKSM